MKNDIRTGITKTLKSDLYKYDIESALEEKASEITIGVIRHFIDSIKDRNKRFKFKDYYCEICNTYGAEIKKKVKADLRRKFNIKQ